VPVLAITGTNGKTTTTALTGHLLRATGKTVGVAGNISPAALTALMDAQDAGALPQVWVLELSSFQLETTETLFPAAATVLNISDDHLDRYIDLDEYASAKARIFKSAGDAPGIQVLNRDDTRVCRMVLPDRAIISFGLDAPAAEDDFGLRQNRGEPWLVQGDRFLLPVSELPLAGLHNAANAMAALALCSSLGFDASALLPALRSFRGLPHRVERLPNSTASAGTTIPRAPTSAPRWRTGLAANWAQNSRLPSSGREVGRDGVVLRSEGRKIRVILGGDGKGQDFSPLRKAVARHARAAVLIGRDGPLIEKAIGAAANVTIESARDMDDAVSRARALARPGDAVLLSPACASFDMFRNYEHRAQVFIAAVRAPGGAGMSRAYAAPRRMPRPSSTACCCGRRSACSCSDW
jgi:UDP-N-acetylmuramoylalanine--D-glutamate ligase